MYTVVKTKKNRYMVSLCTPRSHKNIYVGVYKTRELAVKAGEYAVKVHERQMIYKPMSAMDQINKIKSRMEKTE